PHALPERTSRAHVIGRADRLRDEWIDAEDDSRSDDREREEDRVRDARCGELACAEPAEDGDVDEAHHLRAGLRGGNRTGEPEKLAELASVFSSLHRLSILTYWRDANDSGAHDRPPLHRLAPRRQLQTDHDSPRPRE